MPCGGGEYTYKFTSWSQGMILIPDPLFNEPNVEQMRSTIEGDARSKAYNFEVRQHRMVLHTAVHHLYYWTSLLCEIV